MHPVAEMILPLINSVAVPMLLAYMLIGSRFYSGITRDGTLTPLNKLSLIFIFGIFSIYGTLSGIPILGGIANIRDLGPAIAGLLGGPLVGLGAGLIGGIHRFSLGGFTREACSLATVLAGLAGGIVYTLKKEKFIGVSRAVALAAGIEVFHMLLALMISRPFAQAVALIRNVSVPMILANSIGMGLFAFIIHNVLRERAKEKELLTMESELRVAHDIQKDMIFHKFPPYPDQTAFELHALLEPAKEVGGDLYDFFLVDDHHLLFYVGDVSGKGIPAALFMAVTITLMRTQKKPDLPPHELLTKVNRELCQNNENTMFVTIFLGILDIRTGKLVYANAGHNPPLILSRDGGGRCLESDARLALGVYDDSFYETNFQMMEKGDMLLLFTDGVTEAMNSRKELYTNATLLTSFQKMSGLCAKDIAENVLDDVHRFAAGAPQSDDITILTLKYKGEACGSREQSGEIPELKKTV